jgi:hypothetical protein
MHSCYKHTPICGCKSTHARSAATEKWVSEAEAPTCLPKSVKKGPTPKSSQCQPSSITAWRTKHHTPESEAEPLKTFHKTAPTNWGNTCSQAKHHHLMYICSASQSTVRVWPHMHVYHASTHPFFTGKSAQDMQKALRKQPRNRKEEGNYYTTWHADNWVPPPCRLMYTQCTPWHMHWPPYLRSCQTLPPLSSISASARGQAARDAPAATFAATAAAWHPTLALNLTTPTVPRQNPTTPPPNSPAAAVITTSKSISEQLQRKALRRVGAREGRTAAATLSCGMSLNVKVARGRARRRPRLSPAPKPETPRCVPAACKHGHEHTCAIILDTKHRR